MVRTARRPSAVTHVFDPWALKCRDSSIDKATCLAESPLPFFHKGNRQITDMMSHLVDEAAKKIQNVPFLVNMVSKRVRQLSAGHRPMIEVTPRMGFADIALQEIIDGKLSYELKPVDEAKE